MSEEKPAADPAQQVHIISTLHFVLANERSAATNESIGRSTMYLTSVSMTIVALGLIATATRMTENFYIFALVLLACLVPLGLISFNRVVQIGVQDIRLSYTIGRFHRFYATASPGIEHWMGFGPDDHRLRHATLTAANSRFQDFFTAASMIGAVNSTIAGAWCGLAIGHYSPLPISSAIAIGLAVAGLVYWLHLHHQARLFAELPPLEQSNQ
jgi:hypothetical protein